MKEKSDIVYDTTVVIAEDELLVRIGIKSSVDWEKNGFKLLGEAADGNEAIQMVRKFLPHILLLDIKMPGMSGLDILKIIQLEKIPTKVIIISGLDDFMSVKSAMQSGAYDYIHKPRMGYEDLLKIMLQIQQDCRKEERKSLLQEEVTVKPLTFRMEKSANYPYHLLRMIYSFYIYAGTASFGGSHPNAFNFFKYAWIFRSALN